MQWVFLALLAINEQYNSIALTFTSPKLCPSTSNYILWVASRFLLCGEKKKEKGNWRAEPTQMHQGQWELPLRDAAWTAQPKSLVWKSSLHLQFFGNWISRINFPVNHRIGFQLGWVAEPHSPGPCSSPGLSGYKAEAAHSFMPLSSHLQNQHATYPPHSDITGLI